MDSRDSTSSSSMAMSREVGSSTEEDGVLSVTDSLAKDSSLRFRSQEYVECVDVLKHLLQKKEDDPKVLHNIAVAEFLRDGCSDPKKLLELLIIVKKKSEDLSRASREQMDAGLQPGNKATAGPKGANNGTLQISTNSANVVYTDEFDASVAALNIATVLFHLHEYTKASSVLEPLFQNIEPIEETAALRVCLLLLDIALVTQDASRFAEVIIYLEKAFGISYMINQTDSGGTGQQQSSNVVAKSSSVPNSTSAPDELSADASAGTNASENSLSRTFSDETMEYETLLSTLDISGQNSSRSNLSSSNDLSRSSSDRSTPGFNLKLQLPLYKVQLLLLSRNLKAAKREVKLAMNIARGVDSSRALLLKSQLEYARGNYFKALKLLKASTNQGDVASSIIINNNIGCIHYQQGTHHASSIFFHKALSDCLSLRKEKPRKLSTFSQDKSLLIAYNCGVQYLACGKPVQAANCFQRASFVFSNRPLLWLRLAECCLMALEKGLLRPDETLAHGSEIKVRVIGHGKWRQLAVDSEFSRNGVVSSDEKKLSFLGDNGEPTLSMSFACQCLLNALHLLSCSESKYMNSATDEHDSKALPSVKSLNHKNVNVSDSKTSKEMGSSGQFNANGDTKEQKGGGVNVNAAVSNSSMSEYEDICRRENQMIKQAVLVDLVFVELELGNPLRALSTALSLLELPECSRMYSFLGHVYAAEALCLLNRPREASEHLSVYLSGEGQNVELPYSEEDYKQWQPKKTLDPEESNTEPNVAQDNFFLSPEEARGTLYVNLAAMSVIQGDLEQAYWYAVHAMSAMPNSREAILMNIYLDLKLGKAQEALTKLKQCNRVTFISNNSFRFKAFY